MSRAADEVVQSADATEVVQAVVLDWHDGPVEGYLETRRPAGVWRFELVAERPESDTVDSRVYLLAETSADAWQRLLTVLGAGTARQRLLVPDWQFATHAERAEADAIVDELLRAAQTGGPELLVRSETMRALDEVWRWRGLRS